MSYLDETCDEDRVVAAVKEFTRALDAGEPISIDAFLTSHADLAAEIRPALEGLLLVHGVHSDMESPSLPDGLSLADAPSGEFTAKPIGDFQIIGELGRGGMGVVYEAVQLSLGRRVALKVLPFASGLDEVRLQRFRNEAHAAAALHHTNIVPVYAVGTDRGVHYYAMQLIEGQTLAEVIDELRRSRATQHALGGNESKERVTNQRRRSEKVELSVDAAPGGSEKTKQQAVAVDTAKATATRTSRPTLVTAGERNLHDRSAVRMIRDAALAIHHAHVYGVVHRDVKPANLIRDHVGKIWVTDFGLAQIESDVAQLTRTGDPMGTLRYMSPEQATGNRSSIDHRTDIYSLGVTLYELLTLRPAFENSNYRNLLNEVVEKEPPPMTAIDGAIPRELDTIVRKAMSKSAADRYATAEAFADDLQAWLDDKPIAARPPTVLERLSKWRRRNSGLVAAAGIVLLVTTMALATTTLVVLRQQSITRLALDEQTRQRRLAESNFAQARAAVDAFSELSERELAYRSDLQDLRREFLETSLGFYEEFLAQRSGDETLSDQLSETSTQVRRMVRELEALDRVQPMLLLVDRRVQQELGLGADDGETLAQQVNTFREQRESLANQNVGGLLSENDELTGLLNLFDQEVSARLSENQLERLAQIHRQRWLPFSFKSREMVRELGLSREQIAEINRIIEVTRPNRFGRNHDNGFRREIPRPFRGPGDFRPPPPEPRGRGFEDHPPGAPPFPAWHGPPPGTDRTVQEILKILSPEQRQRWHDLVGKPFWFPW